VSPPPTAPISWVRLDLGDDSHEHLIDPDHLVQIATQ
jgi:arylsulfatase